MLTIYRQCTAIIVLSNLVVTQTVFYVGQTFSNGVVFETIGDNVVIKYTEAKHVVIVPKQAISGEIEGEPV